MKRKFVILMLGVLLLVFAKTSAAEIVQLDLFSLGCPTEFNFDLPSWQTNFDIGVTFSQIDHVYIDWSGKITAGLFSDPLYGPEPFPRDVAVASALGTSPNWRHTAVYGGATTYPVPEIFGQISEFIYGGMPWSEIFDGQGLIKIKYDEGISTSGSFVQHGSVSLTKATLIVDGTVIPEPTSLLFLAFGAICPRLIWAKQRNKNSVS